MKNIIHKMCENPIMSNIIRNVLEGGMGPVRKHVRKYINLKPKEKVLDVACGTGEFCELVHGDYTGVDLDSCHIDYAKKKFGKKGKRFLVMDATKLKFKAKSFDHAMFLSFLHHTPTKLIGPVLRDVARVTKGNIVFVDLVPHKVNFIGNFFLAMDQGKYIRKFDDQLDIIKKHLDIVDAYKFRSGINIHSLIVARPKK